MADQTGGAAGNQVKKPARREPTRPPAPAPEASRRFRIPAWILVLVAFVAGGAAGVQTMRVRHHRFDFQAVAAVNGVVIDKQEFFNRLALAAGPQTIHAMVGEELSRQFSKTVGAVPTAAEVEARYAQLSKAPNFKETMAKNGDTPQKMKDRLRDAMARENVLNKGMTVTDADVRKFYDINVDPKNRLALYYTPERVQVAVIVNKKEADIRKAMQDLNRGIAWATVVKNYSQENVSKINSGVLPPIPRGRMQTAKIPGFEDTIFGMKIGDTLGPRNIGGMWWIIRCLDKKPAETKKFDEVKDLARTGAMLMKGLPANSKKVQQQFEDFQNKANIQAFWPQFKDAVKVK